MTDPELAIRRGMPADSRGCYDVFLPEVAMTHLLGRRFRMDTFFTFPSLEPPVRPIRPLHRLCAAVRALGPRIADGIGRASPCPA